MTTLVEKAEAADPSFRDIPIIDLLNLSNKDPEIRRELVDEIRNACINVGFFYVKNHGIPDGIIQEVIEVAKEYFALPLHSKMELDIRQSDNFKGYQAILTGNVNPENEGDLQEGFELGWESLDQEEDLQTQQYTGEMAGKNVWPAQVPTFRPKVLQYYHAAVKLGRSLFPLFALALNLPESFFDDKTKHSAAIMKVLHYPPQSGPVGKRVMGIGAHTDWECFTILWQQPGIQALQVLNSKGQWINAQPIPSTFIINLGDQFARWTNDIFKSTVHRAINNNQVDRYAIPLFFGTDYHVKLEPIPGCTSPCRPHKYEVVTAGEYVKSRLESTYHHNFVS